MHPTRRKGSRALREWLRAGDDGRWKDADGRIRMALGLNM